MDVERIGFFAEQLAEFHIDKYKNELQIMRLMFDSIKYECNKPFHDLSCINLRKKEREAECNFSEKLYKSRKRREDGNRLYNRGRSQTKDSTETRHMKMSETTLAACRLYTQAILEACMGSNLELAFAFANRGMALQTFGYYRQAYDDYLCALANGYPFNKLDKLRLRQAYCALQLGDCQLLAKHLAELKGSTLNANHRKEFNEILEGFEKLKFMDSTDTESLQLKANPSIIQNKDLIQITASASKYGSHVKAKRSVRKFEVVFYERAQAAVPIEFSSRVCSHCAITNFIPIPCVQCYGYVVYCSLDCLNAHKFVHSIECRGYQIKFFEDIGIGHLALRTITDNGLLSILPQLKHLNGTEEVWEYLICKIGTQPVSEIPYIESLKMCHHLDKMSLSEVKKLAYLAYHIYIYLKYYTNYFQIISKEVEVNCDCDCEWIVAALLLRHIGQMICNAHTCTALLPMQVMDDDVESSPYHLLNEHIWHTAWHLKVGQLHIYNSYGVVAAMNLPLTSQCNHACQQVIQLKYSGRKVEAYAMSDFKTGDEITNCYVPDHRQQRRAVRRMQLEASYHFKCECRICLEHENDDVFEQFHQYRCCNASCGKIFVPNSTDALSNCLDNTESLNFVCTICGAKQRITWLQPLRDLLSLRPSATQRKQLYKIYNSLDEQLLGPNYCKSQIADSILANIFNNIVINDLDDQDYEELLKMLKFLLSVISQRNGTTSIPYVATMTYLWDLIAVGKYVCDKVEISDMLQALNMMSDDVQIIFNNYYNDYIKIQIK